MNKISINRLKKLLKPIMGSIDCDHCQYRRVCLTKTCSGTECVDNFVNKVLLGVYTCSDCGKSGFVAEDGQVYMYNGVRLFVCKECGRKTSEKIMDLFDKLRLSFMK